MAEEMSETRVEDLKSDRVKEGIAIELPVTLGFGIELAWVWWGLWSVFVICISAFTIGIGNFVADALHIVSLGYVWMFGILALTVGLLIAGLSAFWCSPSRVGWASCF